MKTSLWMILILIFTSACQADLPFQFKNQELNSVFVQLTKSGLPTDAARRYLEFIDQNQNRLIKVKGERISDKEFATHQVRLANQQYGVIIDYSQPSNQRRLYFINLKTKQVDKYFVAHGVATGINHAVEFSNQIN